MDKFDVDKKTGEIKERMKNNQRRGLPDGMKKCPFQSSFEGIPCTPECALYRSSKQQGYNCPVSELVFISWSLAGKPARGSFNNGQGYQKKY